jgi:hypothetical protein
VIAVELTAVPPESTVAPDVGDAGTGAAASDRTSVTVNVTVIKP